MKIISARSHHSLTRVLNAAERSLERIASWYERVCSIKEIREQLILQWAFGASLFYFFVSFSLWIERATTSVETAQAGGAICWPYFQNCSWTYFLHTFPYGYSQTLFYMFLYAIMVAIVYFMWKKEWSKAHVLLSTLLLWKLFVIFVQSFVQAGPYDYYHIFLTLILLYVPCKEFFLKLAFVFFYFMSVTVKFTPGWVLGTYFTSMRSGLPVFPDSMVPLLTNFVIFVQIVDCWFLMSKNRLFQRASLIFGIIFHLYSGVLVSYNYPSAALPPLLILFGPLYRYTEIPFGRKTIAGWVVIGLVAAFQLLGFVVSPDRFLTMEGHRYGMFMFEANHQCTATIRTYSTGTSANRSWSGMNCTGLYCLVATSNTSKDGMSVYTTTYESASAWNRCDPYEVWTRAKARCGNPSIVRISMQFDHSINGGPFYRIVDESSICDLTYKPFSHNDWIKLPPEAPIVGYPVKNFYSL
ncbi:MAG TPA: hypothetical protein VHD38_00095 [Candidatus Paceibacterota bacterium]|nr:hypothetical protein [Candidatus Paceibacterota bacterium]